MEKIRFSKSCSVCTGNLFAELMDFGLVPQWGYFLLEPDQEFGKINLSFEYCQKCALIRQKSLINLHNYVKDSKRTGHTLQSYAYEICEFFHQKGIKNDELIVEIGSNDGSFLEILSKSGFTNLLGIEPSIECSSFCKSSGFNVENVFFNSNEVVRIEKKYGKASAVVCRHVLGHVPNPYDFAIGIKNILKMNGIFFVEVPDSRNIIYDLKAHELIDDVLTYFTLNNIKMFLHRAGFKVDKVLLKSLIGAQTLLLWCSINSAKSQKLNGNTSALLEVEACYNFKKNWKSFREEIIKKAKRSKKPLISLGASHPQTGFLIFTGTGNYVSKLVDDDSQKIDKYVYALKPIPIISTKKLLNSNFNGTILNTAFGYNGWLKKICNSINNNFEILQPYPKK